MGRKKGQKIGLRQATHNTIDYINKILEPYEENDERATLRTIYYQLLGIDPTIIKGKKGYTRVCYISKLGRRLGTVNSDIIQDLSRIEYIPYFWNSPEKYLRAHAKSYRIDLWETQPKRLEIWCEKNAILGTIDSVADQYNIPVVSCRGYSSMTQILNAVKRIRNYRQTETIIAYLGDRDPSGEDMPRSLQQRLKDQGLNATVKPLTITDEQITKYNLPDNTIGEKEDDEGSEDTRLEEYLNRHNQDRRYWEVDALGRDAIREIVQQAIDENILDKNAFHWQLKEQQKVRQDISEYINGYHILPCADCTKRTIVKSLADDVPLVTDDHIRQLWEKLGTYYYDI